MEDNQPMWGRRSKVHFAPRSAIKKTEDKNVEISEELIKMFGKVTFEEKPSEEPYQHLEAFEDICDLFKTEGDEVNRLKDEIRNFKQGKENLERAWGRNKDLFLKLPNQEELRHKCGRCGYAHPTKFCTSQQSPRLPHPKPKEELIELILSQFMIGQGEINAVVDQRIQIFASHIAGLRIDLDHMLRIVKEVYPHVDLDVKDTAKVFITTRGGKVVEGPSMPETDQIPNFQLVEPEAELPSNHAEEVREEVVRPRESNPVPTLARVPYPARMPNYVNFIKELVSNKANLGTEGTAFLNAECSTILFDTPKKGDPGSFTIPCYFGKSISCRALADLGASINLMTLSFYQKLGLGDLKNTRMTIQLVDWSIKYPVGIAENILVQVDMFVFPADFVILDIKDEVKVPLILGRPFLNTVNAIILVAERQLSLGIGDDRITFSIDRAMSYYVKDSQLSMKIGRSHKKEGEDEFEEIKQEDKVRVKTSLEEPPNLELKDLPEHLEYQFLEGRNSLPIIISSLLKPDEKERLLEILKTHKKALAWKISDIPGISPSFCTHKILMEENFKPCVQKQRRLNPKMQEVVKIEVIKLLDTGIIYPISDSPWERPFPLPFIDQMLERLAGNDFYCFLDGFLGYFQIRSDVEDQEKTTFTCPYGTFAYRRMRFGLCNAPTTFQRCMTTIFQDMIEDCMEVFMDDFSVFGNSFDACLKSLDRVLARCEESHLVTGKNVTLWRFIKDFSKITRPLTELLEKDAPFIFDEGCTTTFETLKHQLRNAPIMVPPDWSQPFEIMCDATDYAIGAVLGQRINIHFQLTSYVSRTLNDALENYTTTEKELLAVVFAIEKFWSYLVLSKIIVYTDHSALKYLFVKPDAKPRLIRWILLLQEFDIEERDKKGAKNVAADHLSRLENPELGSDSKEVIRDKSPDENLSAIKTIGEDPMPWYADFANYLAPGVLVKGMTHQQKGKFFSDLKHYFWAKPYLFRMGPDRILRRCVSSLAAWDILENCHKGPTGGHFGANLTAREVLESGFYWPTIFKDAHTLIKACDAWQRTGNITKRDEMPQKTISVSEVFDVWGIDFMCPFPDSQGNKYILVKVYLDDITCGRERVLNLHELEELRSLAYENSRIYKEQCKKWYDAQLKGVKIFKEGDKDSAFSWLPRKREIEVGSTVDLKFMNDIGFGERLSNLLRREYRDSLGITRFVSNDWEKALKTHEPIYVELVLEFLATFEFDEEAYNANKMCDCEPDDDFSGPEFWATIGYGPYQRSNTKERSIIVLEHRLLHKMLAHTLTYRRAIKEKVPESDIWLLSQLVDQNAFTNLAYVIARMFLDTTEVHDRAGTGLCGGQFITVIAEKLGTLTPNVCASLTQLSPMGILDRVLFRSMKLIVPGQQKGTYVWIGDSPMQEGPSGMATSTPQPNQSFQPHQPTHSSQQSQSSEPNQQSESSGPHDLGSLHTAIKELSMQVADGNHDTMEELNRLSYNIYGVRRDLSWITASISEYFESVGHHPSVPLASFPLWPDDEDAPPGYSSYDEWVFANRA
ncbi:hypothetical protein OSB04_024183 [Centaurea solstitialis]|uniref:RNA-directed DNA polymerase n=1 Tax=Centaurea solstitialis TaxID=347529 RepID=A0AA38WDM2_9ASTR|nr:hypothetical protein OSB04_024183 [Centaurea solstitialis]